MASVKHLFIYMPQDEIQLGFVTEEYKDMGLRPYWMGPPVPCAVRQYVQG